jgi:hypothetical protein
MTGYRSFLLLCATLACFSEAAFAAYRFDISIEGPWILYELKQFDGTNSMLVAIAPNIPGHNFPVFTTGDGASMPTGIFCVAFVGTGYTGTCSTNGKAYPAPGSYPSFQPLPVKVFGSTVPWDNVSSSATALILPMPDSISSDGIDPSITLRNSFSLPTGTQTPSLIGVQLHYDQGPPQFNLLKCGVPASAIPNQTNCSSLPKPILTQDNSGTLRIAVKAMEHSPADDPCDYHVRIAHHARLVFLDPTSLQLGTNRNQSIAYLEHSTDSPDCRACDPQQDLIPSFCELGMRHGLAQVTGRPPLLYSSQEQPERFLNIPFSDLGAQLEGLDTLVDKLNAILIFVDDFHVHREDHTRDNTRTKGSDSTTSATSSCPSISDLAANLKEKLPTFSQLKCVELDLGTETKRLESSRCKDQASQTAGTINLGCDDARSSALIQLRGLSDEVVRALNSGTSGKDCRAPIMMIN